MYDHVTKELPEFVDAMFPVDGSRKSITGHSMGGKFLMFLYYTNNILFYLVNTLSCLTKNRAPTTTETSCQINLMLVKNNHVK